VKLWNYSNFIPQNVAPYNAVGFVVTSKDGKEVGGFKLQKMRMPRLGSKLYSFGALSDVHIGYETSETDFRQALTFLNDAEKVNFICVCGDLTANCIDSTMTTYKNIVDTYSPNTPVYEIAGNHESYDANWEQHSEAEVIRLMQTYTGKPLRYSFTQGNDVFIMLGICRDYADFGTGGLQWLYETLEANRNKRCFVFQHIRPDDACGNAYGIYKNDIWQGTQSIVFESLLKHYRNSIFFHGHSHLRFGLQTKTNLANYDDKYGMHSIHIPSLVAPRDGFVDGTGRTELYAESEGYVVDVYQNHIVLRGRDFAAGKFLPIATYCLDTTLQEIEADTYVDSTGTIVT
jgi:predicted phosphodiesterase